MNIFFDVVLFIVSLAINSLLLGLVVTGGIAMAFQLIRNSFPRLRYALAVAGFVIAAFVPLAVTFRGAYEPPSPPISITNNEEGLVVANSDHTKAKEFRSDSAGQNQTLLSPRTNLLNDLTLYVGGSWLGVLFSGMWIFVSIHLLLREIAGYQRLRNERKRWRHANAEQRQKFSCPDAATLYFADEGFFTTGFLSPAIVLPHRLPPNLSRLSVRGIVLHEIAHAKWRDAFVNSLLRIVRGFFWVNPSLWFLDRIICAEREAAADRSALVSLSISDEAEDANADYATAIVSIAKLFAAGSSPQERRVAALYFGAATNLENRIHRILNVRSQPKWARLSLGFAVFLTSLLALTIIPVASIPLTTVRAEIAPVRVSDTGELNASGFGRQDLRLSLQRDDDPPASVNVVTGNTTSSRTASEKTEQQDGTKKSAPPIVVKTEVKVNEPITQTKSSAPNPKPEVVYRGDSAVSVVLPVRQEIKVDVRPEDIRPNINLEYLPKPVMRLVVRRPVISVDYTK
jgi:beta-lactamase regulating signal transducer with metallopeptidase domain